MKRTHLRAVGGVEAERLARALAAVADEPPGDRLPRLVARLAGAEGPPEPAREAPRDAAPEAGRGAAPEAAREAPQDAPREAPRDAPREVPHRPEPPADLMRRVLIEYGEVLKRYRQDFDRITAGPSAAGEDATLRRLEEMRLLLIKYPVAAQALFAALVAEGRRFATTPEGAELKARLAASELVRKGRGVFEAVSAGLLGEHAGPLPSEYLEALLEVVGRSGLEGVLGRLFGGVA